MHILILPSEHFMTVNESLGGIFQLQQAKALLDNDFKVGIIGVGFISPREILKSNKYSKYEQIDGIPVYRKYIKSILPTRITGLTYRKQKLFKLFIPIFEKYIKEHGMPDVVHAHNFLFAGFIAEAIKTKYNIPYIITEHSSAFARGMIDQNYNRELTTCASNAKVVSAVSTPFTKLLTTRLKVHTEVLPNIVDKYFISTDSNKEDSDKFNFLNIAGFNKNKNQKLLIDAFADAFKDRKNVFLKIGGYGVLEGELKNLVKEYSMEDRIIFLGLLTQDRVKEEMDNADCFVLSSNYETFGVVLIESLACGTPVIATKCGGPEDIVDESNGILINVGDKSALKRAMHSMYENKNKYDRKLLSGVTIERFGEKAFVDRVTTLYNRALEGDKS